MVIEKVDGGGQSSEGKASALAKLQSMMHSAIDLELAQQALDNSLSWLGDHQLELVQRKLDLEDRIRADALLVEVTKSVKVHKSSTSRGLDFRPPSYAILLDSDNFSLRIVGNLGINAIGAEGKRPYELSDIESAILQYQDVPIPPFVLDDNQFSVRYVLWQSEWRGIPISLLIDYVLRYYAAVILTGDFA